MPALAASNQRIRRLRRLSGRRSARRDERAFVIEGPVLVAEALRLERFVEGVYVDADAGDAAALVADASERGVAVHEVAPGVLDGISDTVTPRPVMAVAAIPEATVADVVAQARGERRHLVVLVEVRDPGNLGTLVRAAEASGAAGVLCTTATADPWSPKVVRSSAGSVLRVPVATDLDPLDTLAAIGAGGIARLGTHATTGHPYDEVALDGPVAFVLGNEAHGLPATLTQHLDGVLTIPMEGAAESLNVAMAGAVLMFDAQRQRRRRPSPGTGPDHSDWTPQPADDKVNSP